ncbi:hypothetical protein, partial [Burkholderia ubonensis]|uniref:hypothetical protein n=1 Tax=Burkholderia ubonensis TaxID=101571 RepID=UPI001E5C99CD
MPLLQCDADLAVHLEAADARPVTGAGIDDDERPFLRIGLGRSVLSMAVKIRAFPAASRNGCMTQVPKST